MCLVTFDWEENDAKEKFKNFKKRDSISWAVVEVTDYCNFNCKWCFANSGSNPNPKHMGLEKAERLIETLALAGVGQVTISGGEPTVYPYLKDVIKKANSCGLVVHMNTNGYLLTKKLARELKSLGLSQVQINIDSLNPGNHDFVRGKRGSHERAIQALKNAREVGLTCVSQTVLTSLNENEIGDIFKFARSLGLQRCRVWDMTPSQGCARENEELIPSDYFGTLEELSDFAYNTGACNVECYDPLFSPNHRRKLSTTGGFCVSTRGLLVYIATNGDVHFCCTAPQATLYNIFDVMETEDIERYHKLKLNEFLQSIEIPVKCNSCSFLEKCQGGCYTRREFALTHEDYWCTYLPGPIISPTKDQSCVTTIERATACEANQEVINLEY